MDSFAERIGIPCGNLCFGGRRIPSARGAHTARPCRARVAWAACAQLAGAPAPPRSAASAAMSGFSFSRLVSLPTKQAYAYVSKFSGKELGPMLRDYQKNHVEKGTSTLLIHWALACGTVGYITKRNNTLREIQAGH